MPKLTKQDIAKAVLEGKVKDKTTLATFVMTKELENKFDEEVRDLKQEFNKTTETLRQEIDKSVKQISEVNLDKVLNSVKGKDGESIKGEKGDDGYSPIKNKDYFDGKDYILTEKDKKEIATKIKVPVVEKVVEKTEVIKEQPIITNEIKEVAVTEDREQIVEKLNKGKEDDLKIEAKQVSGLDKMHTDTLNRAVSILDQRTQFLINKRTNTQYTDALAVSAIKADADWKATEWNTHHLRFTLLKPADAYDVSATIPIWVKTDGAITITKLEVSCDANPTTEPTGDIKYADAVIGLANAVVINAFDTTDGVLSDSSITSGSVASGKCIYISFDVKPDAALKYIVFDLTFNYA
jgi:hypothetical protein